MIYISISSFFVKRVQRYGFLIKSSFHFIILLFHFDKNQYFDTSIEQIVNIFLSKPLNQVNRAYAI